MFLEFYDKNGKSMGEAVGISRAVGNTDWTLYTQLAKVPENAVDLKISCGRANVIGSVYFDDLALKMYAGEEYEIEKTKIKNPGFEIGLFAWPEYSGVLDKENYHSGTSALLEAGEKVAWKFRTQHVGLKKGATELKVSVWMKTDSISEGKLSWEGARCFVDFKDAKGRIVGNVTTIAQKIGTSNWTYYIQTVTIPENAVEMVISCGRANVKGKVYFDDLNIEY